MNYQMCFLGGKLTMTHIERISIKNARRLGENVQIDFGSGATIILAPNGTGKTTIFEAIELALTGNIKRIADSLDAIIRNSCSEMSVRLDFSEGKFLQAKYTKSGNLARTGNHDELFDVDKASLPYLFRLTHFLEQRSEKWLIEQNGQGAGNLLSQLPLGKDLQNILSKKTSLLRAIGNDETVAESALIDAKKKLSDFNNLKLKRDSISVATKLTPLDEIIDNIKYISKSVNYDDYKGEHRLMLIDEYFERLKVFINQKYSTQKDLIIRLSILKERIELFVSNSEMISNKQTVLSNYLEKINAIKPLIEQIKAEIQYENDLLVNINNEIIQLNKEKSMFEEVEHKRDQYTYKNIELEQNETALTNFRKTNKETAEYLAKTERIRDQHKIVYDEITAQKNYLNSMEFKRDYQKKWQVLSAINKELIEEKIPELEKKKSEYIESTSRLNGEVSEAEKHYAIKKRALEALNSASNAIQDAVSSIKKHLPENQRKCPVCQAEYEPGELVKKIEASLETIDPSIPQAIEEERKALEMLEIAKEKRIKENQKLLEITTELNSVINKIEENQKKVAESYIPQFPGCKTPEEAQNYIDGQVTQAILRINQLEANKSQLEPEVSIEELNKIKLKKSELERTVDDLVTKNQHLQNEIAALKEDLNRINESLNGKEKKSILQSLSNKLFEYEKKKEYIRGLDEKLSKNENELKEYQNLFLRENDAISNLKGIQDGILTEWRQAGFEEQPEQEKYKMRYEDVSKSIEELEQINVKLSTIEQELSSWRTVEKYNEADKEIKRQIGNVSEENYLESLEASVTYFSGKLQNIAEKRAALNLFFDNVMEENREIHKQLDSINEPWKRLLKRIIINPLISSGPLLSNTTSYNKPIAKTSAIIHEHSIDITKIASEAQITDLQLTLMLTMANKYQWTKWKGFLLDDPTQHHDLVHASSVFDILRDYIIEFDYQVMLSTHDSTHARFFHRKLENEGVPSKIYQLVARSTGVTAERIY